MAARKGRGRGGERKRGKPAHRVAPGRPSLFPGKYAPGQVALGKISVTVTPKGKELLERVRDDLFHHPPVGPKTISDAVEYAARKVTNTSMTAS